MKAAALVATLILLGACGGAASAAEPQVGKIVRSQGTASGTSDGVAKPVSVGAGIFLNEVLTTGTGARLEVTFDDGTNLTLGEKAKLTVDAFVYQPAGTGAGSKLALGVDGAFRYVSGQMTKIPASSVSVHTPIATLGIRGTDFWGGGIDGGYGVVLFEGTVSVTTTAGIAFLTGGGGTGVNITGPGRAPEAVGVWAPDKITRALSTVAFR